MYKDEVDLNHCHDYDHKDHLNSTVLNVLMVVHYPMVNVNDEFDENCYYMMLVVG
jgi:hypothetical protein